MSGPYELEVPWDGLMVDDVIVSFGGSQWGRTHAVATEPISVSPDHYEFKVKRLSSGVPADERRDKKYRWIVERDLPILWRYVTSGSSAAAIVAMRVKDAPIELPISLEWGPSDLSFLKRCLTAGPQQYIDQICRRSARGPNGEDLVIAWEGDLLACFGRDRRTSGKNLIPEFPHRCPLCGEESYNGFLGVVHRRPNARCTARTP